MAELDWAELTTWSGMWVLTMWRLWIVVDQHRRDRINRRAE